MTVDEALEVQSREIRLYGNDIYLMQNYDEPKIVLKGEPLWKEVPK